MGTRRYTGKETLYVLGSAGLARETAWIALAAAGRRIAKPRIAFISPEPPGRPIGGLGRIEGDDAWLSVHFGPADRILMAIGDPGVRKRVGTSLLKRYPRTAFPNLWHPGAIRLGGTPASGVGNVFSAGCLVSADVALGDFNYVNYGCTVGHDVCFGSFCSMNPGAHLGGGVKLGDAVLIGALAVVLEGISIGDGAVIGAGAVVTHDVPAGETVVGVPARPRR